MNVTSNALHGRYCCNRFAKVKASFNSYRWKISLDRGLDIFQHYEMNDTFTFANRLQQYRPCKAFEITFIKHKRESEGE